jgi:chaperonin GroEL
MQDNDTKVLFGDSAVSELMKGVNVVCDAVSTTLGPRGRNVAMDKGYSHLIIHDGVKTALEVNPKNPVHKLGAKIIKEAAKKQRDVVGDGTTAVMVLAQAILEESLKATSSGINPMSLRRGLEEGSSIVIKEIEKLSKPVTTLEQKVQVATISAEDETLGKLIAETVHKVGKDGVIVVEESKLPETTSEMQEGMQFDRGYAHPWLITDPERQIAVIDDVHILITDKPLNSIMEIGKFLELKVLNEAKVQKMVFISPEIGGDFLSSLVVSKAKAQFLGLAVKCPMVGSHQIEFLQDLCAMTGAKLVSKDAGHKFEDIDISWCGKIDKIISTKINTTITGGRGLKDDVLKRIAVIKKQQEDETISDFDKEKLKERLAKLTSGVAVIKVGGETEIEMNERKERVDDAKCATQAAVKHGVVPGGETAYLLVRDSLDRSNLGQKILYDAMLKPFRKLVENAGFDGGELYNEFKNQKGKGFNVVKGVWVDLIKEGILDPTQVPVTAIKSAVSVAIQILTTGATITPDIDDNQKVLDLLKKTGR